MKILGISSGFHDASISVIEDDKILFAGHSERYSKNKHDAHVHIGLLREALQHGYPDVVSYYETPWLKKTRQLYAGQYAEAFDLTDITVDKYLRKLFPKMGFKPGTKFVHQSHHLSHAAASFQTSPFDRATVVVIDGIGEWDTISIFGAEYNAMGEAVYKTLWKQRYPHSIGLYYSAMTQRVGLRPLDEEYILMGMAAYGNTSFYDEIRTELVSDYRNIKFAQNLHTGVDDNFLVHDDDLHTQEYNIAASSQLLVEVLIQNVMIKAAAFKWSKNLVYAGGVALNCSANRLLGFHFDNIWIMPNPGDAGSSLGAAALVYKKKLDWQGPYLGTDITGAYPVHGLVDELLTNKIVGVANGRAEYGPRALGNRSLLADPRGPEIKDKVNEIKRRQLFRPFAPIILEEHAHLYFKLPMQWESSPYMQVTSICLKPNEFPAIIHKDGTSRVQTVAKDCKSGIRQLLEAWYAATGCPMLLNTSLNIRGEPMVNDRQDADRFETQYGVKVLS
jgi:carbamoyltransferase